MCQESRTVNLAHSRLTGLRVDPWERGENLCVDRDRSARGYAQDDDLILAYIGSLCNARNVGALQAD